MTVHWKAALHVALEASLRDGSLPLIICDDAPLLSVLWQTHLGTYTLCVGEESITVSLQEVEQALNQWNVPLHSWS
jgi:hypothetical protein